MPALKARPAKFDRAKSRRNSMIGKVHVAKRETRIEEDDYRQLVLDVSGQPSLAACSEAQIEALIGKFIAKGWKPIPKGGTKSAARHQMALKARALWISLYHLGVVRSSSEQSLEAFAKRQLGCEKLNWAIQSDGYKLIEALKTMAKRAGWLQFDPVTGKPLEVRVLKTHLCEVILRKLKDGGAVPDDWSLDVAAFRLCGIETGGEEPFSTESYDTLAKALGDKLRALVPSET